METRLAGLAGLSALTLVFLYSQLTRLVLTTELVIFMFLLSGVTISFSLALIVLKAGNK